MGQATRIAPLQPFTLAAFRPWGIQRELVVRDLPRRKDSWRSWIGSRLTLSRITRYGG